MMRFKPVVATLAVLPIFAGIAFVRAAEQPRPERMNPLVWLFDTDGDGSLSAKQFETLFLLKEGTGVGVTLEKR